jgi:mannose/cellobiose epimerase-like protein (N-acyl-D-glucosamine 2-epimerase family)/anti-anti-sigma regulatory factor
VPNNLDFTFSDLIAGYIISHDPDNGRVELNTSDGRPFSVQLTSTTTAEMVRNLGDAYVDATTQLPSMLEHGRLVHVYGIFYPSDSESGTAFEAKHVLMFGKAGDEFRFESPSWWGQQVRKLADFYLDDEFGPGSTTFDYRKYRTDLSMEGLASTVARQETDTISRLVYGLATAYLMSGNQRYKDAAVAGAEYMIEHLCFVDRTEQLAYWYHGLVISPDGSERKVFASDSGDDYDAIPCYEQIYALAGLTQVFRITGDPKLREIIDLTIAMFHRYFEDKTTYPDGTPRRGYYSHIDPVTFDPLSPALNDGVRSNADRKNWNSIGDHIPAYLINLYLATGEEKYADELESLCDQITTHFPDYDSSPFVQEKFFGDWSHDSNYGSQLDRAIVGHNLKIAWNLTRMNSLRPKAEYVAFAKKIADLMPGVGMDTQRGGWYDMMERHTGPGEKFHRLVWHDRKAWWQQEQGILAYQILNAVFDEPLYAKYARESAAFYNGWMLDAAAGGVFFNVLANGNPFILGAERSKGSHSMAMYHSAELGYLSAVYSNLETRHQPMDLFFAPDPGAFGGVLRVSPDLLPPKSVSIMQVWVNGHEHADFDAEALTVTLPHSIEAQSVRVRLVSASCTFSADTLDITGGVARIALAGSLSAQRLGVLREQVEGALDGGARTIVLEAGALVYLDPEAVRYLALVKQHRDFRLAVTGARGQVTEILAASELNEELVAVGDGR